MADPDVFEQHDLTGVEVYTERDERGDERVWLVLHMHGRELPIGIPFEPAWAEALSVQLRAGLDRLRSDAPRPSVN